MAQARVSAWNVANYVTVLRLVLIPVFIGQVFTSQSTMQWLIAAGTYLAIALSDLLDGYLARHRNLITDFGKIADPIADKGLIGSALVSLSLLNMIPWWVTIAILIREVAVTLIRFYVIRRGVIPASRGGKMKTLTQNIFIIATLIPHSGFTSVDQLSLGVLVGFVRSAGLIAAVLLTVGTGIDYVVKARNLLRGPAVSDS